MFEPKTYQERRARLNEITVHQLLQTFAPMMGEAGMEMIRNYNQAEMRLRRDESLRVLGTPELAIEEAVSTDYITGLARANLGRTFFNAKAAGTTIENAIGTKGFGMKYKDWLNGLPTVAQVLEGRSYPAVAAYETVDPSKGQIRIPVFVIDDLDEEIHLVTITASQASIVSLSIPSLPEGFSFSNETAFQHETYPYRGGLRIEQFTKKFAQALAKQYDTPRPFLLVDGLIKSSVVLDATVEELKLAEINEVDVIPLDTALAAPSDEEVQEHLAEVEAEEAELKKIFEANLAAEEAAQGEIDPQAEAELLSRLGDGDAGLPQ